MTHRGTGRKHVQGQHVKCKHAESHDAHRSGAHKANVEYKPEYMSKGQQSCLSLLSQSESIHMMEARESQVLGSDSEDEAKNAHDGSQSQHGGGRLGKERRLR